MAANWTAIEDALRAWAKAGTALTDAKVIWSEQTGARPAAPFVTLRIGDVIPLSSVDEVEELTDLDADPGEEVELRAGGFREFTLSLQAFAATVTGANTAREYLTKAQTALALPSVRAALFAAGIAPFDTGTVQTVNAVVGTKFEARAVLEVRFYVHDTVSEYTGFIEEVESTSYMGPPDSGTRGDIDI